jgi:carbonic anhydrase
MPVYNDRAPGRSTLCVTKHIALLTFLAGCNIWKAPDRIEKLEARVDELSAEVSAMAGKPIGGGAKKHGEEDKDEHGAPVTASAKPADDEHDAPEAKDEPKEKAKEKEAPHKEVHWTYTGDTGPMKWAALDTKWAACGGAAQSPIDLELQATKAKPIAFDYKPTAATVVDNGHTLQVNLEPGSKITIDDDVFELVQFHVHTPSEHTIAGESFPMEVHLVHKDKDGKLAVVGVMYEVGESKSLEPVWSKWPAKVDAAVKLKKPFDPTTLLPESRTVVSYSGSLTTPPCTEGVMWNVMRRTRVVTQKQLDVLHTHYPKNARPVMPRGERVLL